MALFFKNRFNTKLDDSIKKHYMIFNEFVNDLKDDKLDLDDKDIDSEYRKLVIKFKNDVLCYTSIDSGNGFVVRYNLINIFNLDND